MEEELGTPWEHPLIGGHLPFEEKGITPPLEDGVMDVCVITFDQLSKRII